MRFITALSVLLSLPCAAAFSPRALLPSTSTTTLKGYLDDLSEELYSPDANPIPEEESREATNMEKDKIDRYSVGDWSDYVEFDEFDGGEYVSSYVS